MMVVSDIGFKTLADWEMVLGLPYTTRMEKRTKRQLIAEGIGILEAARDEPQMVVIDDGPVDPANPEGPHNTHEIPVVNPIWMQYGFSSMGESQEMLNRFLEVVL